MVDTSVRKLATYLGDMKYEQEQIKSNMSPADPTGFDIRTSISNMILAGTIIATQKTIATTSFVIDHPVYGYLDSATLQLDGGYVSGSITMPITMPLTFGAGDTVLYTTTF